MEVLLKTMYSIVLITTIFLQSIHSEQFALYIHGKRNKANEIANKYNLVNQGEIFPNSNIYHFSHNKGQINKRSYFNVEYNLRELDEIRWIKKQDVLKRVSRSPDVLQRRKRQDENIDVIGYKPTWNDPLWSEQWHLNQGVDKYGNSLDMNIKRHGN